MYLTYFKKLNDPLSAFYSLVFYRIIDEEELDQAVNVSAFKNFVTRDTTYPIAHTRVNNYVSFVLQNKTFINNDLNISENDFNIIKDIILYTDYIKIKPNIWSGLSFESDHGLTFKYKGDVDKNTLHSVVLDILDVMKKNCIHFHTDIFKSLYNDRINFILSEYKNLKLK